MLIGIYDFTEKEYKLMYRRFKQGFYTEEEFNYYCRLWLEKLMKENQDILIKLKNI